MVGILRAGRAGGTCGNRKDEFRTAHGKAGIMMKAGKTGTRMTGGAKDRGKGKQIKEKAMKIEEVAGTEIGVDSPMTDRHRQSETEQPARVTTKTEVKRAVISGNRESKPR